jgi:class 3 adenylate cyclase
MDQPEIKYAMSRGVHIAYETIGEGPVDLVMGLPWVTHLAVSWEDAPTAQLFQGLASFTRLVLFDKRGVGLSDRDVGIPTLEERMDDFRAVMDAVGSRRALLLGMSESAAMSVLFAAAHPERTLGLILIGGNARSLGADDYPWGKTREEFEANIKRIETEWGTPSFVEWVARDITPTRVQDATFKKWFARELAFGASPSSAAALERMDMEIDVRSVLPAIHVPTLVLAGNVRTDLERSKYIASNISGAKLIVLPGRDHYFVVDSHATEEVVRIVQQFARELPAQAESERILTTVLFTDIVESTRRALELGDRAWSQILEQYFERARESVTNYRGRMIKTTGDGFLATFDGPTRAVRCACTLRNEARAVGFGMRAGLHSGECLMREGDVQGIAVHIAARVCELAKDGEVLVSGTVRDLSVGSDVLFRERGARNLRGVEGDWRIYSVENS